MIRKATSKDASDIAHIVVDGWDFAYRGHFPDSVLDSMTYEKNEEKIYKRLIGEDKEFTSSIIVYEENDKVIAFAYYGKNLDSLGDDIGEIPALYVAPEYHRKGIGRKITEWVKKKLKEQGFTYMIIWCLKDNVQAVEFYKAMGGTITNERNFEISGELYREVGIKYEL